MIKSTLMSKNKEKRKVIYVHCFFEYPCDANKNKGCSIDHIGMIEKLSIGLKCLWRRRWGGGGEHRWGVFQVNWSLIDNYWIDCFELFLSGRMIQSPLRPRCHFLIKNLPFVSSWCLSVEIVSRYKQRKENLPSSNRADIQEANKIGKNKKISRHMFGWSKTENYLISTELLQFG